MSGRPVITWTVAATDHCGKPTERHGRLNRIRWPGVVIFDFCGGPGSSRGRYVVACRAGCGASRDVVAETGAVFRRLSDLYDHLEMWPSIGDRCGK